MTAALIRVRVAARQDEALDICSLDLVPVDGSALPAFSAGAHIDVHLPGGLVRQYSLCNPPGETQRYRIAVLRDAASRGGSATVHDQLQVGTVLDIGAPRNLFELDPSAPHHLLLAGGIGITPLKAMAHTLAAQGASFELHYCTRSPRHAAFRRALQALVPEGRLHLHHDHGNPAQGLDIAGLLKAPAAGTHLYYCGPAGFMKACADASAHWPAGTVHSEHFKAPEPAAPKAAPDGAFEVQLARSGVTLQVPPEQSIVRAIELSGHRVPTSCLSGLCGACKVNYLAGEVDHQDYILSDEERKTCMTVCVSRAKGPVLVLDL